MTSYKDALVLLNDLEQFADTHDYPEAEDLIARARMALEKDMGSEFPRVRPPQVSSCLLDPISCLRALLLIE